jgi:hypothetical protein
MFTHGLPRGPVEAGDHKVGEREPFQILCALDWNSWLAKARGGPPY